MLRQVVHIFQAGLVVGALLLPARSARPAVPQNFDADSAASSLPEVSYLPEVRLRKLHLVRPDLIPYPIAYEVIC